TSKYRLTTVPATGDGTSTSTLSVEISTIVWSTSTRSPSSTAHSRIVPSVTDSPAPGAITWTVVSTAMRLHTSAAPSPDPRRLPVHEEHVRAGGGDVRVRRRLHREDLAVAPQDRQDDLTLVGVDDVRDRRVAHEPDGVDVRGAHAVRQPHGERLALARERV